MARRKLSDDKLRELVASRLTKGDAFRYDSEQYEKRQQIAITKLQAMTRDHIFTEYPEFTYDVMR